VTKRAIAPVEDDRVRLRLLSAGDLPETLEWRNRDEVRRWFFSSDMITFERHADWFARYTERDDDFVFIIEDRQGGCRPVGQAALYRIDWSARRAEFGRLMIGVDEAAGKGLAFAATRLALKIAFEQFGLDEVYLDVFSHNRRAIDLYHGVGFTDVYQDRAVTRMVIHATPELQD
jgi:RimJ/RimL family protein N-acetyltransferase